MNSPAKAAAPLHILIAEDSPTQAIALQHILEQQGYRVTAATNGRGALDALRQAKPALVISDVVMPDVDGYELCTRIKADGGLRDTPVILVTTLSDPEDVIRGLECGADNFILKPYDADNLLRRIQFVLANSHVHRTDQPEFGLEIVLGGQRHVIRAGRLQILNLLLSTYEAAMQRNTELSSTRDALRETNAELQQLTRELEDRVLMRTRELELSNEALRRAQQALVQQERLRALGQMASGIAHDINNAISPIALYTEALLEREPGLSDRARDNLVTIQRAIDDVAQTVTRMREFYRAREVDVEHKRIELNTLAKQVIDLTQARWSDQPQRRGVLIEVKAVLAPDLPGIRGAENEIRDALTNLIFNAVDALPDGGVIEVRTSAVARSTPDGTPAPHVRLEVNDSGAGMDEETRRRCLEPFFTTKGERGTGLGLAMVYGMAQRHGAILEIDSRLGAGTTIRLLLPVPASNRDGVEPVAGKPGKARSLRVLVADDDTMVLESLCSALRYDGHKVTAVDGGQAAITAFRDALKSLEPFDIVFTDLGMPLVDGRRVAAAIRAESQSTPVVMLTGWGPGGAADHGGAPEADRVLSKPPRLKELRAALAELTARSGAVDDP